MEIEEKDKGPRTTQPPWHMNADYTATIWYKSNRMKGRREHNK